MRGLGAFRFAAGFALLLAVMAANIGHASAGAGRQSLTIHNRICPTGYTGSALFADCHGNPQDSNLEFTIDGSGEIQTQPTDDNGNVTFNTNPGTYNISGGVPGEFATTTVWCSVDEDPDTLFEAEETATGVSVDIEEGTDVICDWYNTPIDLSGGEPTPTPTPGGVSQLPNTGAGDASDSGANLPLYGLGLFALGAAAVAMRRRALR